jgi:hypothetical protein
VAIYTLALLNLCVPTSTNRDTGRVLDDGVRLNIRPFMAAKILREQPKGISWSKDRGTDVSLAPWFDLGPKYGGKPGDRINDHHLSLAEKRAARSGL